MFQRIFLVFVLIILLVSNPAKGQRDNFDYVNPSPPGGRIQIGLITDLNSEVLRYTFENATTIINAELTTQLEARHAEIDYGNSMQGVERLCRMMEEGVGAVFGPSALTTGQHLMNVCDSKDLPYILSYMSDSNEGFNLHPHPADIAQALHAVISAFEWSRYIFLYQNAAYLSILDALMSIYGSSGPFISVVRYDLNLNGNFKSVLRRVRKSVDSRLVVVGSSESVAEVLKQAQQVGIMNEDYTYIIGNLDFHTFDLEEYKYSDANITGFRMFSAQKPEVQNLMREMGYLQKLTDDERFNDGDTIDSSNIDPDDEETQERIRQKEIDNEVIRNGSCPITMEMALLYDAVIAFAETTKHIQYMPQPLDCKLDADNVQEDGSTFKNYMRSLDFDRNTLTGRIIFDGPRRKGYALDVIELQSTGLVKVGVWEENKNFTFERPPQQRQVTALDDNSMVNKTYVVLISVPNPPYASLVESHKKLHGNNMYQGYGVDLIKELADILGFNFTLKNGGSNYGSFNKTTNTTTGMLKRIVDGEADLAITDLTITSEREEVVDFTIPFMNTGIAILYLKPQKSEPTTFSFMDPFSKQVWKYLGIAFLSVSLCFFILGRLSPTEWDNPYPCIEEPEELENQFTINNSLWFTTGAFLQQGSEIAPKALSTRTVAAIWCFFTLIIVSSYTANLAAFLTIENPTKVLENVKDLSENKGGVQYGAKKNGATRNFFATSAEPIYIKMHEYMSNHQEFLTESNQEGVDRVTNSDTKGGNTYAFLMESTSIEYNTVRNCKLQKVGDPLDEKGYGIAMKKNWPYRDKFNNALLELQEQGVLAKLKKKWWNEMGASVCTSGSDSGVVNPLAVNNLEGIYYVLIVGSGMSIVYGVTCWIFHVIKKAHSYEVSIRAAFWEEIKAVVDVTNNERVLKGAASVYSRSRNSSLESIDSFATDSDKDESSSSSSSAEASDAEENE
uniref:Glutamate receptor ionotropic, kainate 2 n=1 Tax=Stomoxys calcitrans TaxID=35570 RepID=A0A1I8NN53_STOCA